MASVEDMKAWRFERLKHALQALAAPPETQLGLFPDFTLKADELALDFDNFARAVLGNDREELGQSKAELLEQLDRHLQDSDEAVWCDEALKSHRFWSKARVLAVEILRAFGWPVENPPSYRREYVPSSRNR